VKDKKSQHSCGSFINFSLLEILVKFSGGVTPWTYISASVISDIYIILCTSVHMCVPMYIPNP